MPKPAASPRVARVSWGRIEIEDGACFKDVKLFPGGYRAWDWNETGTRHVPGIQPSDIEELLVAGAWVVVLSRGMLRRLKVCPETIEVLESKGIKAHILETRQAVHLYNQLAEKEAVAGLFHTTC